MLPRVLVRPLVEEELQYYLQPYTDPTSREPLFRWPNEIPIEGQPPDVYEIASNYHEWLLESDFPKLFFWATPGRIISEEKARWYLDNPENAKGVYVGQRIHFLQEDHPHQIGGEIHDWVTAPEL